jgi:hypothetical protein
MWWSSSLSAMWGDFRHNRSSVNVVEGGNCMELAQNRVQRWAFVLHVESYCSGTTEIATNFHFVSWKSKVSYYTLLSSVTQRRENLNNNFRFFSIYRTNFRLLYCQSSETTCLGNGFLFQYQNNELPVYVNYLLSLSLRTNVDFIRAQLVAWITQQDRIPTRNYCRRSRSQFQYT